MTERKVTTMKVPLPKTVGELWRQVKGDGASAHPVVQFFKYGVVGGMATVVHIVSFFLLGWFLFPCVGESDIIVKLLGLTAPVIDETVRARFAVYCNIGAFTLSDVFCYILNRIFVFKPGRHSIPVEFFLFTVVGGTAMVIGTVVMTWLISYFGMQTSLAFGANIIASMMLNYVLRRFFIFKG